MEVNATHTLIFLYGLFSGVGLAWIIRLLVWLFKVIKGEEL